MNYLSPTKTFISDAKGSETLLLTAQDVGAWLAIQMLIKPALASKKFTLVLHLSGYALDCFVSTPEFIYFAESSLPKNSDITIVTVSSNEGPERILLEESYSSGKTALLFEGWGGLGDSLEECFNQNKIQMILCSDELAKEILKLRLPTFDPSRILFFDTPLSGFKISDVIPSLSRSNITVAYLYGADIEREKDTYESFVRSLSNYQQKGNSRVTLLVRCHPGYSSSGTKLQFLTSAIEQINAGSFTIDEVCSSSDLIASITSTESFKARYRGKRGVLIWDDNGELIASKMYTSAMRSTIERSEAISILREIQDLETTLNNKTSPATPSSVETLFESFIAGIRAMIP